jgi:hypothetical protein
MKGPLRKNIILSLFTVVLVTGLVCCKGLSFSNVATQKSQETRLPANEKSDLYNQNISADEATDLSRR